MANFTATPLLLPPQSQRSFYTSIPLSVKVGNPKEDMAGIWIELNTTTYSTTYTCRKHGQVVHADTVELFPNNSTMLFQSSAENAAAAVTENVNALQHPAPPAPYAHIGYQQMEALQQLAIVFQRATIQRQPDQPQPPFPLPPSTPKPNAVRFLQHPQVAVPRVTTETTVEHVPRVPTAPKEATIPPYHVLTGPKLVPTAAALPHLIPPDLQPPTPGATSLSDHLITQPQPLLLNTPSTRFPLQHIPQTTFPQPKKAALSRPPHLIPIDTTWYPFRHHRHQQPTLIRSKYANAATFRNRFQANAVIHPTTGALQEFRHLIVVPDKSTWSQSLAN